MATYADLTDTQLKAQIGRLERQLSAGVDPEQEAEIERELQGLYRAAMARDRRNDTRPAGPAPTPTHRPSASASPRHSGPGGSRPPTRPASRPRPTRRSRPAGRGSSRSSGLPVGVPAIPGAAATRGIGKEVIGGVLGLTLAYLLLTDAENPGRGWPSAVQTMVGSITTAVMAIVRPVDPLHPHARAPRGPAAAAAAAGAAAPVNTPAQRAHSDANVRALAIHPGYKPLLTHRGHQRQSNVLGPRLPSAANLLANP
jgi:hypothetical protein